METNTIICGDALSTLKTLPDGIVQTCITSPPYFGLRSYLPDGHDDKPLEIGLEDTPEVYIARLVEVFREVKRVLRPDGTLWVVIGDSYAGSWGNYAPGGIKGVQRERTDEGKRWERPAYQDTTFLPPTARVKGLKPKDLIGIPWMLAFALRADGWYLRQELIWSKPNCMPESVTDRCTKSHETIFMLSKRERYFYDQEAIKEPAQEWNGLAGTFARTNGKNTLLSIPGQTSVSHRTNRDDRVPAGRNKRSVWSVSTKSFPESHFATFPPKLIEPMILAGTSPRACEHCGAPWERVTERDVFGGKECPKDKGRREQNLQSMKSGLHSQYRTIKVVDSGWQPTCTCPHNEGSSQCVILDSFCGAGTVPLVALKYQRQYIGIELNPEYVEMAEKRIKVVQPDLWATAEAFTSRLEDILEAPIDEFNEAQQEALGRILPVIFPPEEPEEEEEVSM